MHYQTLPTFYPPFLFLCSPAFLVPPFPSTLLHPNPQLSSLPLSLLPSLPLPLCLEKSALPLPSPIPPRREALSVTEQVTYGFQLLHAPLPPPPSPRGCHGITPRLWGFLGISPRSASYGGGPSFRKDRREATYASQTTLFRIVHLKTNLVIPKRPGVRLQLLFAFLPSPSFPFPFSWLLPLYLQVSFTFHSLPLYSHPLPRPSSFLSLLLSTPYPQHHNSI